MQEFSDTEQRKLIWIVISFCFSIIALLGVLTLAVLAFFFPLPYAKVLKSVGFNHLALSVYQDIYKDSGDVKDGYAYLMESIYTKYDKHIIMSYELVRENDNFSTFLASVDEANVEKYGLSRNLLGSLDEFDYVSGKYVSSLCKLGEVEVALNFAKDNLNYVVLNFDNASTKISFLIFDYVATCSNNKDLVKVDNDVQNQMLQLSDLCTVNADSFILQTSYTAQNYAYALECAVRVAEIYKSFEVLDKFGVETVISKDEISAGKDSANTRLANVLKKAVN